MWVVAIRKVEGDEGARIAALQAALGLTAYEARPRALGPVPRVVGTFGQREPADTAAAILGGADMSPLVLGDDDIESDARRAAVRSFGLEPEGVRFVLRNGRTVDLEGREIRLLLRGTKIRSEQRVETTTERKLAVGKAVLTGGLLLTKQKKKDVTISTEVREGFLHVYASGEAVLSLVESGLLYDGLGAAMAPTRAANFARLVSELRARAPRAPYDERLLTRAGQGQVLGGVLGPEPFLDVATTVLAATLVTAESSPYR
jgi:hypothetical protein